MQDPTIDKDLTKKFRSVILFAGFLTGTLDILIALIMAYGKSGATPEKVFRYISSGAFGKAAYSGGVEMVLAGVLFHYLIAFSFTIIFFCLYEKLNFGSVNRILPGILYGIFVWAIMNLLIVPLSKIPKRPMELTGMLQSAGVLIIAIGLPLSFIAGKYYSRKQDVQENRQGPAAATQ